MILVELRGAQLLKLFENKIAGIRKGFMIGGGKIEFNPERPSGNRLIYCEINGFPLYPEKIYKLVTTDYNLESPTGFEILKTFDNIQYFQTNIVLRDAVTQFIKNNSPLNIEEEDRWIRKE